MEKYTEWSSEEGEGEGDDNLTENLENRTSEETTIRLLRDWERRKSMAAVQLVCYVVHMTHIMKLYHCSHYVDRDLANKSRLSESVRRELMSRISMDEKCRDIIRMGPDAFARLCELLRGTGRLKDNKNSVVEEQVAKFLYLLAHNATNRATCFFFCRSNETISRHFHEVLRAIITLEDQFLNQPNGREVPEQILSSTRFYPYFKVIKKYCPLVYIILGWCNLTYIHL